MALVLESGRYDQQSKQLAEIDASRIARQDAMAAAHAEEQRAVAAELEGLKEELKAAKAEAKRLQARHAESEEEAARQAYSYGLYGYGLYGYGLYSYDLIVMAYMAMAYMVMAHIVMAKSKEGATQKANPPADILVTAQKWQKACHIDKYNVAEGGGGVESRGGRGVERAGGARGCASVGQDKDGAAGKRQRHR